jgi:hypothetical protein
MESGEKEPVGAHHEQPPDVAALMHEIRRRVAEKRRAGLYADDQLPAGLTAATPGTTAGSALSPERHISAMRGAAQVDLAGEPIRSHRPVTGAFIKTWKRFTRFWIRRYTDPLFLRQSYFNAEATAAAEALLREIRQLRHELEALRQERDPKER